MPSAPRSRASISPGRSATPSSTRSIAPSSTRASCCSATRRSRASSTSPSAAASASSTITNSLPRDRHPDYPELLLVTNIPKENGKPSDSKYTGQQWHSDLSFTPVPSLGSLLRGITIPPVGGDTMFTNMYLAYDTLSDGMKKMIADLHGIHTGSRKIVDLSSDRAVEQRKLNPPIAQPVVRTHPETGRKALYIGEKVSCFVGMTEEESRPLIDYLVKHATRPQFVYRHQWRKNDIVLWDNRCTMHIALGDYEDGEIRHLERTTVKGTPSGYYLQ